MKIHRYLFSLLLFTPLAEGQNQYTTETIAWDVSANNVVREWFVGSPWLRMQRPLVPGRIVDVAFQYTVTWDGITQLTNFNTNLARFAAGAPVVWTWKTGDCSLGCVGGGTPSGSWVSPTLQPDEVLSLPCSSTTTVDIPLSYSFPNGVPEMIDLGILQIPGNQLSNWIFCPPAGNPNDCFYVYWNGSFAIYESLDVNIDGTITWEWEPDLANTVDVCPGDGIQRIGLVGDWQGDVTAYSNPVNNFTMLFIGDYFDDPGSSLCIGSGQRISSSLQSGEIDYTFPVGTLLAGQTYTLQAVHRYFNQIRFSNAILFQPL